MKMLITPVILDNSEDKIVLFIEFTHCPVCRFCVLLITDEDQAFVSSNKAFLDFATANKKDVLRFAYVYQRQQQPLCQALLRNQAAISPQVGVRHIRHLEKRVHLPASVPCKEFGL